MTLDALDMITVVSVALTHTDGTKHPWTSIDEEAEQRSKIMMTVGSNDGQWRPPSQHPSCASRSKSYFDMRETKY